MRLSANLPWRLSAGVLALILILALAVPLNAGDTGTYKLSDYAVTLEPLSTGQVKITIEQQWQVLGGNIPWITVGLPNSHFSIMDYGEAAARVSPENSGGFTGVRIDLDRDYQSSQVFQIKFTVLQSNLLERLTGEQKWRIDYIPGWYDRAVIDHLQVSLVSPVTLDSYSTLDPQPSSRTTDAFTWEQTNLSPGGRFNIVVESTDGSFLVSSTGEAVPGGSEPAGFNWAPVITILIILAIGGLIFYAVRQNRINRDAGMKKRVAAIEKEMAEDEKKRLEIEEGFDEYIRKKNLKPDAEGRYYDRSVGSYITPAIWAAVIYSNMQHQQNTPPPSRPSCACACVSCACACACACAGGGAAGCSRKTLHECPDCYQPKTTDQCVENKK